MTTHTMHQPASRAYERAQRMQDVILVSSFGFWAAMLGLAPVLTFKMLIGS